MVKNLADKFEDSMKKGFTNVISLSIIGDEPSHGYNIKKKIEKYTLGVWTPPDSTLYTVLKQMTRNGLISFTKILKSERMRKVYHLTKKGRKLLDIISQRRNRIVNSTISLLTSIMTDEETESFYKDNFIKSKLMVLRIPSGNLTDEKRLKIMKEQKVFFSQQIKSFEQHIQNLDGEIKKLHKKSIKEKLTHSPKKFN